MQVITLKYLLFRFTNNKLRKFISTKELKSNLASRGFGQIDNLRFRTKIIGKLRDADVIISNEQEAVCALYYVADDFFEQGVYFFPLKKFFVIF